MFAEKIRELIIEPLPNITHTYIKFIQCNKLYQHLERDLASETWDILKLFWQKLIWRLKKKKTPH